MGKLKNSHAMLLALLLMINACLGYCYPPMQSYADTERAATVRASSLNIRSGPGTTYSSVAKLSQGMAVTVIGEKKASDGAIWYQIRFQGSQTGYALGSYIRFPVQYTNDSGFESYLSAQGFPESYKVGLRQLHAQYPNWVFTAQHTNLDWNTVIANESIVGRSLIHKNNVSSWKSIADGAYDWTTGSWPGFDGSAWVAASEEIVRYYMDPRNFLDDIYVFQFLLQSYNSSVHTATGLETMVNGTFLESKASTGTHTDSGSNGNAGSNVGPGVAPGTNTTPDTNTTLPSDTNGTNSGTNTTPESGDNNVRLEAPGASISSRYQNRVTTAIGPGMTGGPGVSSGGENPSAQSGSAPMSGSSSYVDIIMNAGIQSGVNPYVLAAMILQEQGKGTSPLISGTYSGYEGYYNFFNIEAYQSGSMDAIQNGLRYASQSGSYGRPWNSVEKSILGGSLVYGDTYVKSGQDTFYLKKFNVQGSNLYKHQYMTNVQGAASEGALYAKAYSEELKKSVLEFRIPVYQNMPDAISVKPTLDGSPNNKLAGLGVNGFSLTPTFHRDKASYDLIVDTSVAQVTINAAAIDSAAVVSGAGNINLQSGNNDIKISVKAQNGSVRDYVIHVVRQQNGPTHDGSVNTGMTGGSSGNTNSGTQNGPGGPGVGLNSGGSPSGGTTTGGTTTGNTETYGPGGSNITIVQ